MMASNYTCPYCRRAIAKEDILFWEEVNQQYTDNIRGDFLRNHGMQNVPRDNKFPRRYYKPRWDAEGNPGNIDREDENGFPVTLEDAPNNSFSPEELNHNADHFHSIFDGEDDPFDRESLDREQHTAAQSNANKRKIANRACPYCHCELPVRFGRGETHHVAMFGGRAAGKTSYLVNLFQQLNEQLSRNNLGSVSLATESLNFLQPMIEDYEKTGTTLPTPAASGLLPIVCQYKNGPQEAQIVFYDIAGEGTDKAQYIANHQGVSMCDTLLLMIDPNMMASGAYYQQWHANHGTFLESDDPTSTVAHAYGVDFCGDPLDAFLNGAVSLCMDYADNIKNIICVITKLDMLIEARAVVFGTGDIEILHDVETKHRDHVSLQVLRRVSNDLKHFFNNEINIDIQEKVKKAFGNDKRIFLLGVSTSTLNIAKDRTIRFAPDSARIASKHRIIEPFLAVAMLYGLIDAITPDGRVVKYTDAASQELSGSAPSVAVGTKPHKGLLSFLFGGRK